jgi:hypothetical protein
MALVKIVAHSPLPETLIRHCNIVCGFGKCCHRVIGRLEGGFSSCVTLEGRIESRETEWHDLCHESIQKSHCQTQQNQPSLNSFHSHFTVLLMTSKGGFSIIQNKKRKVQLYAQANAQLSAAVHTLRFGKNTLRLREPQATISWHVCPKRSKKKKMCPVWTSAAARSIVLPICSLRLVLALLQCSMMKILLLSPRIFLMWR